jgi:hypothetical protein
MTLDIPQADLFRHKLDGFAEYQFAGNRWWFHKRELADGRVLYLHPQLLGNLRIGISPNADADWFVQTYCFHDQDAAWRAALGWDGTGDPEGWYRHHQTGRRRPDGTPESEHVAD